MNKRNKKHPELDGFRTVKEHIERDRFKIFLNVRARGKCGKTHFLLTAPRPLAYYDVDASGRGPMDALEGESDVHVFPVRYDPRSQDDCMSAWDEFLNSYDAVMEGSYFKSLCIDTQDELLQLQRLGYFGDRRASQYEYATPNAEFLATFKRYHSFSKVLIVSTRMDKEYKESKTKTRSGRNFTTSNWTGGYIAKGKTELEEYLPECNIELYKFDTEDGKRDFGMQVDKLRVGVGPSLEGEITEGAKDVTFPGLMVQVFPDTEEVEWQ